MPLENCPFLKTAFNHCFPCGCSFKQTKKREKVVNVSLFTVGHVFVGFVERVGSGMLNAEFATLFFCYLWKIISHLQYFFVSLFLILQNIKQEVSEVFLACSRHRGDSLSKLLLLLKMSQFKYLLLKRRYLKLINYDSRTVEQCKCEVSIHHFKLILFSLLSLFFVVFSFLIVIFGLSEKRTILA